MSKEQNGRGGNLSRKIRRAQEPGLNCSVLVDLPGLPQNGDCL
jgi:hypothetical protein